MGRIRRKAITEFKAYETRSENGYEKGYMRLTQSLHYSDAVKDLSNLEYRLFMDMKHTSMGHDEVAYTQKMAMEATGCCKESYKNAISMLIEVGLLEKKPRSAFAASVYRFSTKWKKYVSPQRDVVTGKYVRKKTKTKFQPNK